MKKKIHLLHHTIKVGNDGGTHRVGQKSTWGSEIVYLNHMRKIGKQNYWRKNKFNKNFKRYKSVKLNE